MEDRNFRLKITEGRNEPEHAHQEFELVYILEGEITLLLTGGTYVMKQNDIIMINQNKLHAFTHAVNCTLCRVLISPSLMSDAVGRLYISFWCNSVVNGGKDVEELRQYLNVLLRQYAAGRGRSTFSYEAAKYQMLECLSEQFLLPGDGHWDQVEDERIRFVLEYVNEHYGEEVTLEEAASRLYLSGAYLSRLFKKTMGMNFRDYLIRVRMNYALEYLSGTDRSVIDIATACGFSNASVFNKVFKKRYSCTPTAYRKKMRGQNGTISSRTEPERYRGTDMENEGFRRWLRGFDDQKEAEDPQKTEIMITAKGTGSYDRSMAEGINFGTMFDLLQAGVQTQLADMAETAGFRFVRIRGIFMQEMHMRVGRGSLSCNFSLIDQVLDFVVSIGLSPILDLTVSQKNAAADIDEPLFDGDDWIPFQDLTDWKTMLEMLFGHLAERYGADELKNWRFELDESSHYHTYCIQNKCAEVPYADLWRTAWKIARRTGPEILLGGEPSLLEQGIIPDFVTCRIYPYSHYEIGQDVYSRRSTELDFAEKKLVSVKRALSEMGYPEIPVLVAEWGTSVSERNAYNDSCAKAAHLAMHLSKFSSEKTLFCYGQGSDYFSQYLDTEKPLVGANGLLTRDGVRKPGFYVFAFFNRTQGEIVSKGPHHLAVRTESGHYYIAAFNQKLFGHEYFLRRESDIKIEMLPAVFEDNEEISFDLILRDLPEGRYRIRRDVLNEKTGSVLFNWREMGAPERIRADETAYLKEVSRPKIVAEYMETKEGTITLEMSLPAHEVELIHVQKLQ